MMSLLLQKFSIVNKSVHDLKSFDCGKQSMNEFLARYALKHNKLGLSRTYVLAEQAPENNKTENKLKIASYYTLATSTVQRTDIPVTQSLPMYPIPVIILARLAIDKNFSGKGLGSKSLIYALRHAASLSETGLPAYGVILDVLDEDALGFYNNFDMFKPFTNDPMRLFVPLKSLLEL